MFGPKTPLRRATGQVVAVTRRFDGCEKELVVSAEPAENCTSETIYRAIDFEERYFHIEVFA